jgi:hypothetical protein
MTRRNIVIEQADIKDVITLDQLALSGKACDHSYLKDNYHYSAWDNEVCTLCGIPYEQKDRQDEYRWFLWRMIVKKLNLKWEKIEDYNAAFLSDYNYEEITYKGKKITVYGKFVVIDGGLKDATCLEEHFKATRSYGSSTSPSERFLNISSTRAHTLRPTDHEWLPIVNWICNQDPKILDYILNSSVREFNKDQDKKKTTREITREASALKRADTFNLSDQREVAELILNQKVRDALTSVGIGLSKYFSFGADSNPMYYQWTGAKAYLLNLRKDNIDTSGKKLYEAIIDLFGKEEGDEYISNSSNAILKRLNVCILGNVALGLIEEDARTRLAAQKILKQNQEQVS